MWVLPLIIVGAIAVAAASSVSNSRSTPQPPQRQLDSTRGVPGLPHSSSRGVPGPISVLGEILRIGGVPPPTVILCAIAEAEAIGRRDLASDIVQVFVAPVVYAQNRATTRREHSAFEQRGTCGPARSPRGRADSGARGSCEPPRCSCEPTRSPRGRADAGGRCSCEPARIIEGSRVAPADPQAARQPTHEELLELLHVDPAAFLAMMASRPHPVAAPIVGPPPSAQPADVGVPSTEPRTTTPAEEARWAADALTARLLEQPGFAGAGILRADPSSGGEVFEVQWLRGHQIPPLPQEVDGRPLRLAIVDELPVAQPTGLPPEAVAQMQEATGLHDAVDRTRAMEPGSPLRSVNDDAWRTFVARLEREDPTFRSTRHVGQYRQRRERLAELGIDPVAISESSAAQRAALDADLTDAHHHAAAGGLLASHLGRAILVPGREEAETITLSGVLGVIQCAGLEGAAGWLEKAGDRKRYPHTTQAFLRTNGVF